MATGTSTFTHEFNTTSNTLKLRFHVTQVWNSLTNQSQITVKVQLLSTTFTGYGYWPNGTVSVNGTSAITYNSARPTHLVYLSSKNTWLDLAGQSGYSTTYTTTIDHNSDGTASLTVSSGQITLYPNQSGYTTFYASAQSKTFALTAIDRVAPTVTLNASAATSSSINISASANYSCDYWEYSTDNGSTWNNFSVTDTTSTSYTITGLSTGTYNVKVRARRTYNYVYGTSSAVSVSTAPSSFIITPSAINTGSAINLSIDTSSSVSTTVTFKYGSTTLGTHTFTGSSSTYTCPKSWFDTAGVTMLQSMTVTAEASSGGTTLTTSFTLNAGADMKPVMGTPVTSIVQKASAQTLYPNTYITGISKCKVSVDVTAPTNATISSVVLSYPAGTSVNAEYNSSTGKYEATTAAPITGNTLFTVTATDIRGMSSQATVQLSGVVSYTLPSVTTDSTYTYRCDSSGTQEVGGTYYRVKATAVYDSTLTGNYLVKLAVKIKNDSTETNLTSGVQSSPISGMTNPKAAYTIVVTVQDTISGEITREVTLRGIIRDIVIARNGEKVNVGVGTNPVSSSTENTFDIQGTIYSWGRPHGSTARSGLYSVTDNSGESFGKDFLNVNGNYPNAVENCTALFSRSASAASQWSNAPPSVSGQNFAGIRRVFYESTAYYTVMLIEFRPEPGRIWINSYGYFDNTWKWSGWRCLTPTAV